MEPVSLTSQRVSHCPNCVIIGTSGHARVIFDTVISLGSMQVLGFFDDYRDTKETIFGLPVFGGIDALWSYSHRFDRLNAIIGIGDNFQRSHLYDRISKIKSLTFPKIISPHAAVSRSASLGQGTVVFSGAVIQAGAAVGDFCILNTSSSLDHDATMADFSSLAPQACTGGGVVVGKCSSIGINASLKHKIRVGNNTVVGAGATVLQNLPDSCVAVGTPARVVRARLPSEPYL